MTSTMTHVLDDSPALLTRSLCSKRTNRTTLCSQESGLTRHSATLLLLKKSIDAAKKALLRIRRQAAPCLSTVNGSLKELVIPRSPFWV